MNGYANLIAARLRKLAEEASTGVLPVSGHGDGAIFFRGGQVVYAESSRTPPTAPRTQGPAALGLALPEAAGLPGPDHPGGVALAAARSVSGLADVLELTESVIDALTELLSSESRYAKFRNTDAPPARQIRPVAVEALLAEVQRRHDILRQLTSVVTPDTVIAREPSLYPSAVQVSPAQWALLIRASEATTPRRLALQLGRSVFGSTIEVYRLVELGLLVAPGRPLVPGGGPATRRPGVTMSFIRAVSGGRDSDA